MRTNDLSMDSPDVTTEYEYMGVIIPENVYRNIKEIERKLHIAESRLMFEKDGRRPTGY